MRKINVYFILLILLTGCKSTDTNKEEIIDSKKYKLKDVLYAKQSISAGQITESGVNILKERLVKHYDIDLDSLSYLSISYIKPKSSCWYDNYSQIKRQKKSDTISKYVSKSNHKIIYLYHDDGYIDGFWKKDIDSYIYYLFPEGKGNTFCDYLVTFNKYGDYLLKKGHFDVKVANAFKNELENYDSQHRN